MRSTSLNCVRYHTVTRPLSYYSHLAWVQVGALVGPRPKGGGANVVVVEGLPCSSLGVGHTATHMQTKRLATGNPGLLVGPNSV